MGRASGALVRGSAESPGTTPWQVLWPGLEEAVKTNAVSSGADEPELRPLLCQKNVSP